MKLSDEDKGLECVTLKGDFRYMGKHILLPFKFTLCGLPTVDADKSQHESLNDPIMQDMISEYTVEAEFEITCEKCLQVFDIVKKGHEAKKAKQN